MTVKEAKSVLISEINDENSNNHYPYDCKYSRWKIIDYLWACNIERIDKGDAIDWLRNIYNEAGMDDEEMDLFISKTEFIIGVIDRKPI